MAAVGQSYTRAIACLSNTRYLKFRVARKVIAWETVQTRLIAGTRFACHCGGIDGLHRPESKEDSADWLSHRVQGLRLSETARRTTARFAHLGYIDGQNIEIDVRSADGNADRFLALVAELVQREADVIVAANTPAAIAAKAVAPAVPLVFVGAGDPVGSNLVKSLARPKGTSRGSSPQTPADAKAPCDSKGDRSGDRARRGPLESAC